MSAGKGSAPRSCFSKEFKQNYEAIFRKDKGKRLKAKVTERKPPTTARTVPPHPEP
jgi:hypothetical protein